MGQNYLHVIARSEATKQSRVVCMALDCFARNDGAPTFAKPVPGVMGPVFRLSFAGTTERMRTAPTKFPASHSRLVPRIVRLS